MEVSVIQIGNSRGIRIAQSILDQYGIKDAVELILDEESLILQPIKKKRFEKVGILLLKIGLQIMMINY